jgi:3-oxoadipate enol-lactonase
MTLPGRARGDELRTIEAGGLRFNVAIDGPEGTPWLVLSNSLGATLGMWQRQVTAFAQHFRVLQYDTRGHGRSSVPAGPYSIDQLGSDVLRLLDALAIEQAHFCGLSLGGTTGIWLAAHAPDRIGRLALCNTAAYFGPPEIMHARIDTVRQHGVAAIADGVLERWFTPSFRASEPDAVEGIRADLLATPVEGYVSCCAALRDLDERRSLAHISSPTLVIGGTYDPAPRPEAARELASQVPNAQFAELPAAHLTNLGAAQAFNQCVLGFLRRGDSG